MKTYHKVLAEGKGRIAKFCLKEAGAQNHEPTNRNGIEGGGAQPKSGGEFAQRNKALISLDMVNAAVVW